MVKVRRAESPETLRLCFPVMNQLRPHLDEPSFLRRVRDQADEGYRLAFTEVRGKATAVAGYRVQNMLFQKETGRMLYVDDLVTDEAQRSKGHGRALLDWLVEEARREGCDALELDSGVQRVGAHRFYLSQGMHIASYHFRLPLRSAAPRVLFAASAGRAKA
ncbi:MAG: GNAT family N-acetyltransferase [Euryarchaeota archaeon]|nr:GNAT family N-acetyltransferase [Euryarchaeota archaeon]